MDLGGVTPPIISLINNMTNKEKMSMFRSNELALERDW